MLRILCLIGCILFLALVLSVGPSVRKVVEPFTSTPAQTLYPECKELTAAEYNMKLRELDVLLDKIDAMQSDITRGGRNIQRSINVPYNAEQDREPAAVIVGRCLRKLIRERDIDLIIDQYERRANQLTDDLNEYYPDRTPTAKQTIKNNLRELRATMMNCIAEQPQLDMPEGVRDPAYFESPKLEELRMTAGFMPHVDQATT
jgi:hypothetical protein